MTEFKAGTWYELSKCPEEKEVDLFFQHETTGLRARITDCYFCSELKEFCKETSDGFQVLKDNHITPLCWTPIPEDPVLIYQPEDS